MPKKATQNSPDENPQLTVPRVQLEADLDDRINRGNDLLGRSITSTDDFAQLTRECTTWNEYNRTLLRRSFTTDRVVTRDYAKSVPHIASQYDSFEEKVSSTQKQIANRIRELTSIKEQLPLYDDRGNGMPITPTTSSARTFGQTVFLVHGRDDAARLATEKFITEVTDTKSIVLRDQPNNGRTVIEKFEEESANIGFAVVLLTGDDEGGIRGSSDYAPRARQNVVFELGFFVAALGRSRVAVLYEPGVEIPSDMSGVLYTEYDDKGAWKLELAKEMKAAKLSVDLNRAS